MSAAFKQQAHELIDALPDTATWDDLAERIGTIIDIEAGLVDSTAGRVTDNAEVRREFGLRGGSPGPIVPRHARARSITTSLKTSPSMRSG
ncbi:hypothetical protein [Coralloluteibacterium stylophorae]|uniref:hypothetical protein n=1 Tax=Coralloluteibacterium stylophorae TaxID=1776034 RepID=UPI00308439A1